MEGVTILKRECPIPDQLFPSRFENSITAFDYSAVTTKRRLVASNGGALVADVDDGEHKLMFVTKAAHLLALNGALWFPSGKVALTLGGDTVASIWDLETPDSVDETPVASLKGSHRTGLLSAAFLGAAGRQIVTGARDGSFLWSVATQQMDQRLVDQSVCVNNIVVDPVQNCVHFGCQMSVQSRDLRASSSGILSQSVVLGGDKGSCSALSIESDYLMRVGTDRGYVGHFDLRKQSSAVSEMQRPDNARILSFCGKELYSTSLGTIVDTQVAEYGEPIVALVAIKDDKYMAVTAKEILKIRL